MANHRQEVDDLAVTVGTLARYVLNAGAFAFSVWLLLDSYQESRGMFITWVLVAAAVQAIAFPFAGKVKEWISAYGKTPADQGASGFFGTLPPLSSEEARVESLASTR